LLPEGMNHAQRPDPADGRTVQRREGEPEPRLPHEHDESADQQGSPPTELGRQAGSDIRRGLKDTDRGPEMDRAYKQQKRPASGG
jgi:hypothetical protein